MTNIRWRVFLACAALLSTSLPAGAQTTAPSPTASPPLASPAASASPSPPQGAAVPPSASPFCNVQYVLLNWNVQSDSEGAPTDRLLGALYANGKTVGAKLLLFTDTESFEATIPQLRISGTGTSQGTSMFLLELPESTQVKYAYVESYSLDRARPVQCAVMPEAIATWASLTWYRPTPRVLQRLPAFAALSQGALPPSRCDAEFKNAIVLQAAQPYAPPELHGMITSKIAVFLAADGSVAKVAVASSSGNGIADALAEGAAMKTTYRPAMFRCSGVPSQYIFTVDFEPDTNKDDQ